jgi:hypothetical protein
MVRMGRRVALGAVVASVAVFLAPGSATAASGGGCANGSAGGATLRSCISYSNGRLRPDYYVRGKAAPCRGGTGQWYLRNDSGVVASGSFSTSLGHHILPTYVPAKGRSYYLNLWCNFGNGKYIDVDSPWLHV